MIDFIGYQIELKTGVSVVEIFHKEHKNFLTDKQSFQPNKLTRNQYQI
ncbi:MAG: hypothetical protein ACQESM_04455 [Bacteroidota bacterium]